MSAREQLYERMHGPGHCNPPCGLCREVEDLLDAFAHELAEKIRAHCPCAPGCCSCGIAADLIDPEASDD